jgi:hypothetical protein
MEKLIKIEDKNSMTYRLEYNEKQGHFHYNTGQHQPETVGWTTIAENLKDPKIGQFCYYIEERYKGRLHLCPGVNISAKVIKEEWERFDSIYRWIVDYQEQINRFHNED